MTLLFVYGTLKRGCLHHALLAGQQFVREAESLPRYRLFETSSYPCLVEDPIRGVAVQDEVWEVDHAALARLDKYEDVPQLFERSAIALEGVTGEVQAYFYRGDVSSLQDLGGTWPRAAGPG